MLRFVFVKQRAGMFHNDSCWFSNKTCRVDDRAQKSWLAITATTFAELRTTCKKSCTRTNPANLGQQLTKLQITPRGIVERAFSCSASLCVAMCLAEGRPHRRSHRAAPQRPNQVLERQAAEPVRAHCHESRKKFVENRGRRNDTIRQSVSRPGTIVEEFCQVVEANIL